MSQMLKRAEPAARKLFRQVQALFTGAAVMISSLEWMVGSNGSKSISLAIEDTVAAEAVKTSSLDTKEVSVKLLKLMHLCLEENSLKLCDCTGIQHLEAVLKDEMLSTFLMDIVKRSLEYIWVIPEGFCLLRELCQFG